SFHHPTINPTTTPAGKKASPTHSLGRTLPGLKPTKNKRIVPILSKLAARAIQRRLKVVMFSFELVFMGKSPFIRLPHSIRSTSTYKYHRRRPLPLNRLRRTQGSFASDPGDRSVDLHVDLFRSGFLVFWQRYCEHAVFELSVDPGSVDIQGNVKAAHELTIMPLYAMIIFAVRFLFKLAFATQGEHVLLEFHFHVFLLDLW